MPRNKAATNEKIIRSMREEFLTYGYEKASLNRISARVGISTAGLYKHFESKEDMFYFLVKDALLAFQAVSSHAEEQMDTQKDYDPFCSDWAGIWLDLIYEHYEGVKLLICHSTGSRFASFEDELIQREAEGNQAYASALQREGRGGGNLSPLQWHMLSTAYVHLIFETVRHNMTKEEAAGHMKFIEELLYPGWRRILGL